MRTVKASAEGLIKIQEAREKKGWAVNDLRWLDEVQKYLPPEKNGKNEVPGEISIGTWKRFFYAKQPIKLESFRACCEALGLDWQKVADIETKKTSQNFSRLQIASQNVSRLQIFLVSNAIEDKNINRIILHTIVEFFKEQLAVNLQIVDVKIFEEKKNGIQLILESYVNNIEFFKQLFYSGYLTKINNLTLEQVEFLTEKENRRIDKKSELLELILAQESKITRFELTGADLSGASLVGVDLIGVDLSEADLCGADLFDVNLKGANLSGSNLRGADLSETRLSKANLSGANLSYALLNATNVLSANFKNATLTGACVEDWNTNSYTTFDGVICDYIYFAREIESDIPFKERRPHDPNRIFAPGEFAKLVEQSLETVDLIFTNGIDWKAFFNSFVKLQEETAEEILIRAIENKSEEAFVIRLDVPIKIDKAEIERSLKENYNRELALLKAKYKYQLQAKDEQIELYKQQNTNLTRFVNLLAEKDFNIENKIINSPQGDVTMTEENRTNYTSGDYHENRPIMTGDENNFVEKIEGDFIKHAPEKNQYLAETAAEIEKLLEQTEKTCSTETMTGKMTAIAATVEQIENNPSLMQQVFSALKAGGVAGLMQFLNHPLASFVLGALDDWRKSKKGLGSNDGTKQK